MEFVFSASARLAASEIKVSYEMTIGFVMYLCLKNTVPDTLGARVSFTQRL